MEILNLEHKKSTLISYFKSQGFYINDGIKYGIDFLIYTDDSSKVHSKYGILIENNHSFFDLMSVQRVCNSVNKELIVVVFKGYNTFELYKVDRFINNK